KMARHARCSGEHILMERFPYGKKLWDNVREIPNAARTVHPREFHARGASINPANRFEALRFEEDPHDEVDEDSRPRKTIFYRDGSQSIIARNNSPDVGIITKNRLVTRDSDLLGELAEFSCAAVNVSVTSLVEELQRVLEPRTSPPHARLEAISKLREAGVPVGVMVAPVIPGLTDHEMPGILTVVRKWARNSRAIPSFACLFRWRPPFSACSTN